jgi:ADP-heptose:LPS heptosyltransferase
LRQTYAHARITVIGYSYAREILVACPYVDTVITIETFEQKRGTRWSRLVRLAKAAQLAPRLYGRFDLAIIFHAQPKFTTYLAWVSGARVRVGLLYDDSRMLTHRARQINWITSWREENRLVLEAIGVTNLTDELEIWPTPGDEQAIQALLSRHGVADDALLIGLHPGSHWTCQQWSPKDWAALADALVSRYGADLIITGTGDERHLADAIRQQMKARAAHLIDATGQTSALQFAALVRRMDLFICVNSAAPQVSVAVKTPTLDLLGYEKLAYNPPVEGEPITIIRGCDDATAVENWCPYNIWGKVNGCHRAECMGIGGLSLITPNMVLRQAERHLKARRKTPTSSSAGQ